MMYLYIRLHRAKNKPMQEFKALRLKIHIYRHTYKGTKTNDGRHQKVIQTSWMDLVLQL